MNQEITLKAPVELGFVPTHAKFVGGCVPGEDGRFPRDSDGEMVLTKAVRELVERSRVKPTSVQVSIFPGTDQEDLDLMISDLKGLGLIVHLILMVGGVDPMDPADEDATVAQLVPSLEAAKRHGARLVSSTSVEQWMQPGAKPKEGVEFEAAVEQNIKVHLRAYEEAGLADSCIEGWHVEFLRPGEFQTFTDLGKLWVFLKRINERLGSNFFRALVDPAHCGDSAMSLEEYQQLIPEVAAGGGLGIMHASAPTTRGCLSTDDGWVAGILSAAAKTGEMKEVFVEMFHHEDEALAALRELEPGHGVDTRDGRDYTQVVADGLENVARYLNNYVARGMMPGA